jgi:hypothetical protein
MTQAQIDAIVFPVMDCIALLLTLGGIVAAMFTVYAVFVVAFAIDCGM